MSLSLALLKLAVVMAIVFAITTKLLPWVFVRIGRALGFKMQLLPVTHKRLARFKRIKRGYWSFLAITTLFVASLFLELLVNSKPLAIHYGDRTAFPAIAAWADKVVFFTKISSHHSKADFGQLGKGEVDYNAFARLCDDPGRVRQQIDILKGEIDAKVVAFSAKYVEPGPDAKASKKRIYKRKLKRLNKKLDKQRAKVTDLEASFAVFERGDAWIVRTIYPYTPDDFRFDLPSNPPNGPIMARHIDKVIKTEQEAFLGKVLEETPQHVKILEAHGAETIIPRDQVESVELGFRKTTGASIDRVVKREDAVLGQVIMQDDDTVKLKTEGGEVLVFAIAQIHKVVRAHDAAPLGTDVSGRDVVPLMAYGFRISLSFALLVAFLGYCVGIVVGAFQGYYGGWVDIITQRLQEIWGSIPFLFTIIIIAAIIEPSFSILAVLLVLLRAWLGITFYIRGEFYREKAKDYVQAAIGSGVSDWKIMIGHILPNALVPIVTYAPFAIVGYIGLLVSLDYLGFGLPTGTPSWGALLRQGLERVKFDPHLTIVPVLALCATLYSVVMIGEAVREAFDPKVFSRLR